MKSNIAYHACGLFLLTAAANAPADSTWNYVITDAGGGSSLVTWSVNGSLATPPGAALLINESSLVAAISAPGIFADSFAASGAPQSIPVLDGSYFQYGGTSVYAPITSYSASNAAGAGNDSFGFMAPLLPHTGPGQQFLYVAGTQSALIPIAFADFNPGTYQSQDSEFNTALTVNLTVGAVPEPSTLALLALGALNGVLVLRRHPVQ